MNRINKLKTTTTTLMPDESVGDVVHDAMQKLFNEVVDNLDERHQNLFFCGVWGRLEAMAIIARPITSNDVANFRKTYEEHWIRQCAERNTFPCDCGADLNDGEILETNKIQCRECHMIRVIEA